MIKFDKKLSEVEEKKESNFDRPPAGDYILRIINCEETQTSSGRPCVLVTTDIAKGKYAGVFERYPMRSYMMLDNQVSVNIMMSFAKAVSQSNEGMSLDIDEFNPMHYINKLVGGKIKEEEYTNKSGMKKIATKVNYYIPVSAVKSDDIAEPEEKPYTKPDDMPF